jgi:hypothetical protein
LVHISSQTTHRIEINYPYSQIGLVLYLTYMLNIP